MLIMISQSCLTLSDPATQQTPLSIGLLSQRILGWVAISFSRGSSWPRDQIGVSCIAGRFFTAKPPGKVVSPKINKAVKVSLYRLHADNNLWIHFKNNCWVNLLHYFNFFWTSLVVQWLRIHLSMQGIWAQHLPMQGTWVRSLSRQIPHYSEQLSPWTTTSEAMLHTREATEMRKPLKSNEDPAEPKINLNFFFQFLLNVAIRKFTFTYVPCLTFLLDSARHSAAVQSMEGWGS